MSSTLKQEVLDKVAATDDENILAMLKADIEYFTDNPGINYIDKLSSEDRNDLINLLNEPFGNETESYEDFKKATARWRTK